MKKHTFEAYLSDLWSKDDNGGTGSSSHPEDNGT